MDSFLISEEQSDETTKYTLIIFSVKIFSKIIDKIVSYCIIKKYR